MEKSPVKIVVRTILAAALATAPVALALAQTPATQTQTPGLTLNPGNAGGGGSNEPVATPEYGQDTTNPALTTGSRYSVTAGTPTVENPTVPGATGMTIVHGDHSTISLDRRATVGQKTGSSASDAPG